MFELMEKVMLTGLGAVALSQKKVEEMTSELKEKYRLSEEEGKALLDKLTSATKESREKASELIEAEVMKIVDRLGLVRKSDYEILLKRVESLEKNSHGHTPGQ